VAISANVLSFFFMSLGNKVHLSGFFLANGIVFLSTRFSKQGEFKWLFMANALMLQIGNSK
jgi:hypothetical protein